MVKTQTWRMETSFQKILEGTSHHILIVSHEIYIVLCTQTRGTITMYNMLTIKHFLVECGDFALIREYFLLQAM